MKHLTLIRGKLSISQTLLNIKFFHGVLQNILFSSWFSLQKQLGIANIEEEKNNDGKINDLPVEVEERKKVSI